jgi:hypothetical protein
MRAPLVGLLVALLVGCDRPAPAQSPANAAARAASPAPEAPVAQDDRAAAPEPTPPEFDPAPWSAPPLAAGDVPAVYLQQWRKADNRSTCALLAPAGPATGDARPRAATFSGGWAVAYDEPGLRSAFGIAGAGVPADGSSYEWPDTIAWADGSSAGYGPEGGTGPNTLAFLQVAGQGCLYNVWSRHGSAHLVELLDSLRFVAPPADAD